MTVPTQADYIATYQQLLEAQRIAESEDAKEAARHELQMFLMHHAAGTLPVYYASRTGDQG